MGGATSPRTIDGELTQTRSRLPPISLSMTCLAVVSTGSGLDLFLHREIRGIVNGFHGYNFHWLLAGWKVSNVDMEAKTVMFRYETPLASV